MEFLEIRKKASESDDEYIRCFNLIISEIGEEGKDIEKMMLLVLYNGLDPAMRIKMREQPEFPKTQQNLRVLVKKLRATLESTKALEQRKEFKKSFQTTTPGPAVSDSSRRANARAAPDPA